MVQVALPLEANLAGTMERLLAPENREWAERIADNSWWGLREGYISPAAKWVFFFRWGKVWQAGAGWSKLGRAHAILDELEESGICCNAKTWRKEDIR